jgi:hypothetical protein
MVTSKNTVAALELSEAQLISKGGHRSCYRHPSDSTKCIKVLHQPWQEIDRRLRDPLRALRRRRNYDENLSEYLELTKLQKQLGVAHSKHFPQAYGFEPTNLGEGLVVDLIQDYNGAASLTLKTFLWEHNRTPALENAIDTFWYFLKHEKVIVRDPFPHNLLVKRNGSQEADLQIIQIDGFGCSDFLPFSRMFCGLRNRKLDNRRERMERQMRKHLADIANGVPPRGKGIVQADNHKKVSHR